ncbi:tyrosine-type recombinase/integrase [Halopseudomonas phragmitis]|uniref:Integrase n=1 Tax=Halopseudomonas phragmitis TaxID=1931241 RepID=A0A1V0B0G1_9GAMM|nr:site-specific integrase [Halopseudomonas phragmitis]AQZ93419.1 integrase [Halopseudomonas phragmitis]
MTPLRQKMITAMQVRGFSPRTHQSYLYAVQKLARHYRQSPDQLSLEQVSAYLEYLACERHLSASSCRQALHAIRFLFMQVLKRGDLDTPIPVPKQPQRIPELLTRAEVARILAACRNHKHHMMLEVCYSCGLRVSELCQLKVSNIDSQRHLLRVTQGKGAKDRPVILSDTVLQHLRAYWQHYRPSDWLFPSNLIPERAIHPSSIQKVYCRAKASAGVYRQGGIHGLRHAYATHLLEAGLPIHQLQHLLGHSDIRTTLRYVHWLPGRTERSNAETDLLAGLEVIHG